MYQEPVRHLTKRTESKRRGPGWSQIVNGIGFQGAGLALHSGGNQVYNLNSNTNPYCATSQIRCWNLDSPWKKIKE